MDDNRLAVTMLEKICLVLFGKVAAVKLYRDSRRAPGTNDVPSLVDCRNAIDAIPGFGTADWVLCYMPRGKYDFEYVIAHNLRLEDAKYEASRLSGLHECEVSINLRVVKVHTKPTFTDTL